MPSRNATGLRDTPQRLTMFEQIVQRLGLSPSKYATSAELKEWVCQNKDEKYVPPRLLDLWGFEVKVGLAEPLKKPPKRAA
jgi:hypothetical protein